MQVTVEVEDESDEEYGNMGVKFPRDTKLKDHFEIN